jgi:ribosomal protein S18 acetylase RimI-like enzyme
MNGLTLRRATVNDVHFLVNTIIEAEKSGTNILSYSTIFGLTEEEAKKYLTEMLIEEVDGCELSISSFIVAEKDNDIAGAVAAWVEGLEGIPSLILKGNLLNYKLPEECSVRARKFRSVLSGLHIEYVPGAMALGLVYVAPGFRGQNIVRMLIDERVRQLHEIDPDITEMYVQVFGNNYPAIKSYEKAGFKVVLIKECDDSEIDSLLPSNKKFLMKNDLKTNFGNLFKVEKLSLVNVFLLMNELFSGTQLFTIQF